MRRPAVVAIGYTLAALLAAGCTTSSPGELNAAAEQVLVPAVQDVRDAAGSGSYSALRQAINDLKDLVREERDNGDLSAARAAAILDAADALLDDARSLKPTPSPTSESPTPTPTPTETSESPTPTPTPTPTETSESPTPTPTPTSTKTPLVSVSAPAETVAE